MIEKIEQIDRAAFVFLNKHHSAFFDFIFYWASNRWIWIPFYAFLAWFLYRKFPKQIILILFCAALLITLSDQLASSVIKNLVLRLRPCHDPELSSQVHLVNGYCGGLYGFVSSHAANSFSLFGFISMLCGSGNRNLKWVLLAWAVLVSYSRIYLGAHFPGDVLGGMVLGLLLSILIFGIYRFASRRIYVNNT